MANSAAPPSQLSRVQAERSRTGAVALVGRAARFVAGNRVAGSLAGLWVVGLLVAFVVPAPVHITPEMMLRFEHKHGAVDRVQTVMAPIEQELMHAELELSNVRGWFPWMATGTRRAEIRAAREKRDALRSELTALEGEAAEAERAANRELGLFSSFGLLQAKQKFLRAFEQAKFIGKRNTFIDTIWTIASARDQELVEIVARLALYLVVNMTWAMFFMFWIFLGSLPRLIWSFGATWYEGTAFFILAALAAASVMATFVAAVAGAATGATVAVAHLTAGRGRLRGGSADGRRRLHGQPVPGFESTRFGTDYYYRPSEQDSRPHRD